MTGYLDRTGVGGRRQQTMEACSRRSQANFSGVAPEAFQNLLRNKLSSMRWRQIPANRIKVTCWCGSVAESILGEIRRGDVRKNDENLDALVHQLYARTAGHRLDWEPLDELLQLLGAKPLIGSQRPRAIPLPICGSDRLPWQERSEP